jgi:hypothetical protein
MFFLMASTSAGVRDSLPCWQPATAMAMIINSLLDKGYLDGY